MGAVSRSPVAAILVAAALLWPAAASAGPGAGRPDAPDESALWRRLDDAALDALLRGHPTEGVYNDGMRFFEELRADMTSLYQDDIWKSEGAYRFKDDEICFGYLEPISTGCFIVWQRSENCFDLYFAGARTSPNASYMNRLTGTGWDARFWLADRPATCPEAGIA